MQKTQNYNLNKPELTDPVRVDDFNENAEIIDAALNGLHTEAVTLAAQVRAEAANALAAYKTANDAAVAGKAEQSALDAYKTSNDAAVAALNTAVAAGVKLQTGTYSGTGKYGSSNLKSLTFDFAPKFLMVWGPYSHIMVGISGKNLSVRYDYYSWECVTTWSGTVVKWYCSDGAQQQMNESGKTYYYIALG